MRKLSTLFLLSIIATSAFSVNKPKPKPTHPVKQQESLVNKVWRLKNEVNDMVWKMRQLIQDRKDVYSARDNLIPELDKAIHKIDSGEITYWNEEIDELNDRIWDIYNRDKSITNKIEKFNYRQTVVECQLEENLKLKNLVYMNELYKEIGKWNALVEERSHHWNYNYNSLSSGYIDLDDNYYDNVENFKKRIRELPYNSNGEEVGDGGQEDILPVEEPKVSVSTNNHPVKHKYKSMIKVKRKIKTNK